MSDFSYVLSQYTLYYSVHIPNLIISLTFTIAFGILTSEESYYSPCDTSAGIYAISLATFIFLLVSFILELVLFSSYILAGCCQETTCYFCSMRYAMIHIIAHAVIGLLSCFGLIVMYSKNSCGELGMLALGWIIVFLGFLLLHLILFYRECHPQKEKMGISLNQDGLN